MKNYKKLSYYYIKDFDRLTMEFLYDFSYAGFIDNLKEESKTPIAKKIGFDMNLIKRNELNININSF